MKIYIAAKFDRKDEVRRIKQLIESKGYSLTEDWTNDSPIARPYDEVAHLAKDRAIRDIRAVLSCDVFILLTESNGENKGMYVELGAATAHHLLTGKPKIYVVGEYISHGVFYFHPSVIRKKTIKEVLDEI